MMIQFNMLSALFRTNLISSLPRRYISTSIVKHLDPLTYALSNKLQRENVSNLIEEFADKLINMSGKCMDIGCGPGDVTKNILLPAVNLNTVIIGTDISESMIEYAKERYNVKDRLKFEVLDIQTKKLPIKYVSEFDHIFSFFALHWCKDIRQAFENIYHMLRPNGTMLVLFVASHDIYKVLENIAQDIRFASYIPDVSKYIPPHQNSINPRKELKELLQNLGFTVIHCSRRDTCFVNESSDQFTNSIISILEFLDKMPCDLREEFKKNIIHQFAERKICKDKNQKTMTLDQFNLFIVFAKKHAVYPYTQ